MLFWLCGCGPRSVEPANEASVYARWLSELGRRLTTESRLTGSLARSIENPTRASPELAGDRDLADLLQRLARATPHQAQAKTPDQWTAVALAEVLYGKPDAAIKVLEQGLALHPDHPRMQSDLAGALLLRARSDDMLRALDLANRAVGRDPTLATAWFNRALALEELFLSSEAKKAWFSYLEVDPDSPWTAAASQRLADLEARVEQQTFDQTRDRFESAEDDTVPLLAAELAARFAQQAREALQNRWLARWGEAVANDEDALIRSWRERCRALALALDEPLLIDETALLERASDPRARQLAQAYRDFSDAQASYGALGFELAAFQFERAAARFAELGSVFAQWARYYHAVCLFHQQEIDRAAGLFDQLAEHAGQRGYGVLLGYATWMQGVIATSKQDFNAALGHYLQTLDAFTASREAQNQACAHFLLAELYRMLGATEDAWHHIDTAIARRDEVHKPRWIESFLREASLIAQARGQDRAALNLVRESLAVARAASHPAVEAEALVAKAVVHERLGESALALGDLDRARDLLSAIEDSGLRDRLAAQVDLGSGRVLVQSEPLAAELALSRALEYYHTSQTRSLQAETHLLRGRAWLAAGERERAQADFENGIEVFEETRQSVVGASLRISYFDGARALFDELLELEMAGDRRAEIAFSHIERGRARELVDALGKTDRMHSWIRAEEVSVRLPQNTALLYFASLPRQLVVWVLTRDGVDWLELPVAAKTLESKIAAFRFALLNPELAEPARHLATDLYTDLLLPLEPWLRDFTSWVIVPDKALHALPFAALLNPETRRFLIEDHALQIAANASTLFPPAGAARGRDGSEEGARSLSDNIVIFGDPAINKKAFPEQLVHAEEEAIEVAELYGVEPWLGRAATASRFLALAPEASVLHFAGHAFANQEQAQLSYLLLASEDDEPGALFAHQLATLSLRKTRLVILSACSTAQSKISTGEGVLGLARTFLAAGSPNVVASLWDAGDFVTAALMPRFHAHLIADGNPSLALRAAQLELLHSLDPQWERPFAWAGFAVFVAHEHRFTIH